MLLIDTREHPEKVKTIKHWLDRHHIEYRDEKLDTGDYMIEGKPGVVVDRKHDLSELLHNICSKDKARFFKEIRRAHNQHIKLYFLIEHGATVKSIDDVRSWQSKYSRVSGRALAHKMVDLNIAYGVEWIFCKRKDTAETIMKLLEGTYGQDEN